MKKSISAILAVVMLVSLLSCTMTVFSSAAYAVGDIPGIKRVCPGTAFQMEAPEADEEFFAQGWEIKYVGGDWIPYDGSALEAKDDGAVVRYFVATEDEEYFYSNECEIKVAHNPKGGYETSKLEHWHVCADCGGKCDVGGHTNLKGTMGAPIVTNCEVCGMEMSHGLAVFYAILNFVMNFIQSLL